MAVGLKEPDQLLPVKGVRLAACCAGLYPHERLDMALLAFAEGSASTAVFTNNAFSAAPVQVARAHMQSSPSSYCLINAGNANAGTGEKGYADAIRVCEQLAQVANCRVEEVLPFSTGVIGEFLPTEKLCRGIQNLYTDLDENNWLQCARAIMTTDTIPKGVSRRINIGGKPVTITGIAKGSGMIRPDMATMLACIATDARLAYSTAAEILDTAVNKSFNRICVDGDTSTNDAVVFVATGLSNVPILTEPGNRDITVLQESVTQVCTELAQSIIRDGEGASKFITINVNTGSTSEECLRVAYSVATSPLVKTAFYASDPNWGRILAAIGRAGLTDLVISSITVSINDLCIVEHGMRADVYTEIAGTIAMAGDEIILQINLGRGNASETIWTCDLSHEYVRINAEYRT